jgi:hypothetical protein
MIESKLKRPTKRIFNSSEEFIEFYKTHKGTVEGIIDMIPCEGKEHYTKTDKPSQDYIILDDKTLRERYFIEKKEVVLKCKSCDDLVSLNQTYVKFERFPNTLGWTEQFR